MGEVPTGGLMATLTGAEVLGNVPACGLTATLTGVEMLGNVPTDGLMATLTGMEMLGNVPTGGLISTLILWLPTGTDSPFWSGTKGLFTKTTANGPPALMLVEPSVRPFTVKLAVPLVGIVTVCGTLATEGLVDKRLIVRGLVGGGETETVSVPDPP